MKTYEKICILTLFLTSKNFIFENTKAQVKCYFLLHVPFVSPCGLSMTFVTIPMHFTPTGPPEFVFWTLCFLNSFSKEGCYMEQKYLSYMCVNILDDDLQILIHVSSLNNDIALCDSKVKQDILILNVSVLSITLNEIWHSPKPDVQV